MPVVWIFNHYANLPSEAGGTRHYYLARAIESHGWASVVFAADTTHVGGRRRKVVTTTRVFRDGNVEYRWLRTLTYGRSKVLRVLNMISFFCSALVYPYSRTLPRPDAVIGSTVHPLAALAALFIARRYRVPFVLEVRDLWPQTLIDFGRLDKASLLAKLLWRIEDHLARAAERIIVLGPNAASYFEPRGVATEKLAWIPNGARLESFEYRRPSGGDRLNLLYFGAHGEANNLDTILRALQIVKRAGKVPFHMRLVGRGPRKRALIKLAEDLGLSSEDISFEDAVPKVAIPSLASQADVLLIAVADLPELYRFGISMNKLFEYLASGRPVVIAASSFNNPVEEAGCGIVVPPEDPESFAAAIVKIAMMSPAERESVGCRGRELISARYDYGILGDRLCEVLRSCAPEAVGARCEGVS